MNTKEDPETVDRFVELRAKDLSFDRIASAGS